MPWNSQYGFFGVEDDSVQPRLAGILKQDSPLMKQASHDAQAGARKRGLLNSSIAAGAGTAGAINAATAIASQEAGQIHKANMMERSGQWDANMRSADNAAAANRLSSQIQADYQKLNMTQAADRDKYLTQANIDREKNLTSSALAAEGLFGDVKKALDGNVNISADARGRIEAQNARYRESMMRMLSSSYSVPLTWSGV